MDFLKFTIDLVHIMTIAGCEIKFIEKPNTFSGRGPVNTKTFISVC